MYIQITIDIHIGYTSLVSKHVVHGYVIIKIFSTAIPCRLCLIYSNCGGWVGVWFFLIPLLRGKSV